MHLPKNLVVSLYKHFNAESFNKDNINLKTFEKWLTNKTHATLNPITTLIKHSKRSTNKGNREKV